MKPSSLLLRLRSIWIMTSWIRNETLAAAAMVMHRQKRSMERREYEQLLQSEVGQVGVDSRGKMRIIRVMDDYIVPAECGF